MSPRAACRLDRLGFTDVHDYAGGKADWMSFGLPVDGDVPPLAGEAADRDVVRCALEEPVRRMLGNPRPWDLCVVTDGRGVVHGTIRRDGIPETASARSAEAVMEIGPSTVRPSADVHDLVHRLERAGTDHVVVTTPDGRLVGLLRLEDARRALGR